LRSSTNTPSRSIDSLITNARLATIIVTIRLTYIFADSTRLLFATWWIFILILTSFYTANLTAFLTKPQFTLPIKSLHDIAHKNYHWVAYKGRTLNLLLSQASPFGITDKHVIRHDYKSPDNMAFRSRASQDRRKGDSENVPFVASVTLHYDE